MFTTPNRPTNNNSSRTRTPYIVKIGLITSCDIPYEERLYFTSFISSEPTELISL